MTTPENYKWVQRQRNALLITTDIIESSNYQTLTIPSEIIEQGSRYFLETVDTLFMPSKAFSVAIIYALLIEKIFSVNFYRSLNDPDLLCGNDPFFSPYEKNKDIYDQILRRVAGKNKSVILNPEFPQIQATLFYFAEEFDLELGLVSESATKEWLLRAP